MIYSSFVLCSGHMLGCIVLYGLACSLFVLNMYLKDRTSYRFKEGWEEYKNRSYMLLFKFSMCTFLNVLAYIVAFAGILYFLSL